LVEAAIDASFLYLTTASQQNGRIKPKIRSGTSSTAKIDNTEALKNHVHNVDLNALRK